MKWKLIEVQQETDHPYLNYFTLHYQVEKMGKARKSSIEFALDIQNHRSNVSQIQKNYQRMVS